jgi:hypothetical protein
LVVVWLDLVGWMKLDEVVVQEMIGYTQEEESLSQARITDVRTPYKHTCKPSDILIWAYTSTETK